MGEARGLYPGSPLFSLSAKIFSMKSCPGDSQLDQKFLFQKWKEDREKIKEKMKQDCNSCFLYC